MRKRPTQKQLNDIQRRARFQWLIRRLIDEQRRLGWAVLRAVAAWGEYQRAIGKPLDGGSDGVATSATGGPQPGS